MVEQIERRLCDLMGWWGQTATRVKRHLRAKHVSCWQCRNLRLEMALATCDHMGTPARLKHTMSHIVCYPEWNW